MENIRPGGLTGVQIKRIAMAAMLIDHIAWTFVPFGTAAGQAMHLIGRITAPTLCFFIAEGYAHTRSVRRYALRLGAFAVISQAPFTFFETGKFQFFPDNFLENGIPAGSVNVIYTLFLSLLAVWAWDAIRSRPLRLLAVAGLCILALPGDWMYFDILFSLAFWVYRGNLRLQMKHFAVFAAGTVALMCMAASLSGQPAYSQLFQAGLFLCIPILLHYNGRRGGAKNEKWAFYLFYPAHLAVIGGLAALEI